MSTQVLALLRIFDEAFSENCPSYFQHLQTVKHRWHVCEGGAAPTPSTIALSAGSPGPIMALINAEHFP